MKACPDHDVLFRMLRGELHREERDGVQHHLDGCTVCHDQILAIVQDGEEPLSGEEVTRVAKLSDQLATAVQGRRDRAARAEATMAAVPAGRSSRGDELAPGVVVDGYEVLELLGRGGMGEVYLAEDKELGRKVALKLIVAEAEGSDKAVERFQAEARAMARFSHPNIVSIYAVGEFGGSPYVALEFVEGVTLHKKLWDEGALPVPDALAIGLDVARGLAEAHRHGVLHRDLKPANIILGEDGRARILDFGLATFLSPSQGAQGQPEGPQEPASRVAVTSIAGTPRYMAPEQWLGTELSGATDVWALGAMLYEMCAGRPPFIADTSDELRDRVTAGERPPSMRPEVDAPFALDEIVARCLSPKAVARPSAAVVNTALSNILDPTASQESVVASMKAPAEEAPAPPPPRSMAGALAFGALLLGGVGAYAAFGGGRAPDEVPPPAAPSASSGPLVTPTKGLVDEDIAAVNVGRHGGCAMRVDQTLLCWGQHSGDPEHPTSRLARPVPELEGVITMVHGAQHVCALLADRTLRCWGQNDHGQLGDGTTQTRRAPVPVVGNLRVKRLSAGADHTCILTKDKPRKMLCWGRNDHGQLGVGDRDDRLVPTEVPGLPVTADGGDATVHRISAGGRHSCAVTSTGELNCFGHNDHGQLGLDPARVVDQVSPALVPLGDLRLERIYTGTQHSCGRTQGDRDLHCWGDNEHGQLGDGTTTSRHEAKAVVGFTEAQVAYPGARHTCVYNEGGDLYCFGANDHGQLGLPVAPAVTKPQLLRKDVKLMGSKGAEHSCWLQRGGVVECTGLNDSGQLGDGTFTARHEPVPVGQATK